jgi:hypothetical protein
MSTLFREPFPLIGVSAVPNAIRLCLHAFRRNRPSLRLNPISPVALFRQSYRKLAGFLRDTISPENSITARIFMKAIIKPLTPFSPYRIMDLGTLTSPEYAAFAADTPRGFTYTLAPAARLHLAVCRAADL